MKNSKNYLLDRYILIVYLVAIIVSALVVLLIYAWLPHTAILSSYEKVRGSLIGAYLSSGSLLFSLNTFFISNIKKEIFDSKDYQRKFLDKGLGIDFIYAPLLRLSALLGVSILLSVFTSLANIILGFLLFLPLVLICVFLSCLTLVMLLFCIVNVMRNLAFWLKISVKEA